MSDHKTNPNDPTSVEHLGGQYGVGLTKREYFAAMALQGLCARQSNGSIDSVTHNAVRIADELIKALNKK